MRPEAGAARWLSLAAAPTFAAMALLTASQEGGPGMLCAPDVSPLTGPLTGMTAMYGLMAAFHAAPWLRLLGRGKATRPASGAFPPA